MAQSAKHFAERLNICLDEMDAPTQVKERSVILSKMLDISKHQAWTLLEGLMLPNAELLQQMAEEFDVDPMWLSGEHNKRESS